MYRCIMKHKTLSSVDWSDCEFYHTGWLKKSPPSKTGKFYNVIGQKWHRRWFVFYRLKGKYCGNSQDDGFRLDYYKTEIKMGPQLNHDSNIHPKGRLYLPDLQEVSIVDSEEFQVMNKDLRERSRPTKHIFSLTTQVSEETSCKSSTSTIDDHSTLNYRNDRTYYFAAESQDMVDNWVNKLCLALNLREEDHIDESRASQSIIHEPTDKTLNKNSVIDLDIRTEMNPAIKKLETISNKPYYPTPPPLPPKMKLRPQCSIKSLHSDEEDMYNKLSNQSNALNSLNPRPRYPDEDEVYNKLSNQSNALNSLNRKQAYPEEDDVYNKLSNQLNGPDRLHKKLPPKPPKPYAEDKSNDPLYDRLPIQVNQSGCLQTSTPLLDDSKEADCTNAQLECALNKDGPSTTVLNLSSCDIAQSTLSFKESKRELMKTRSFKRTRTIKGPLLKTEVSKEKDN